MKNLNNSRRIAAKILLAFTFTMTLFGFTVASAGFMPADEDQPFCVNAEDCTLDKGVDIVKDNVNDIEKDKTFSDYVQEIVKYLVGFVGIIGVLYIIYAGFTVLLAGGDETKAKKAKSTITYVIIGLVLMFMAYPIFQWAIKLVNSPTVFKLPDLVGKAYAYTLNDTNTFDEYKKKIELLTGDLQRDYKVNGEMDETTLSQLQSLVEASMKTFPDNNDFVGNTNIAKNLLISIEVVKGAPDSNAKIGELAKNINLFLTKIKIPRISAKILATPQSGSAPLTVSLRAQNVVDPSGVVVPSSSYVWWIKNSSGGKQVLGTGPSINYTFKDEKNYLVNLDIVSSSRNSNGKIDVLPFSNFVKVDVLQSVGNIYFYINGINVSDLDTFKITPAIGRAGIILDTTASLATGGSKFVNTSWDFGNGLKTVYDSAPRMERQYYTAEGTYRLTLKLRTNEGNYITKNLDLEVRDPIASIMAKKNSGYVGDEFKFNVNSYFVAGKLAYEWKVISLANNETLYSSSNDNIAYKFRNTGKFAVKLKSMAPSGKEDNDTLVITIESRDPYAVLNTKQASPETPNTYLFDASTSYDPDTFDNSKLNFSFSIDGEKVELENSQRNGSIGNYTFNTLGNHTVVLEVSNVDGKVKTVKKTVNVQSLLSVKMQFTPKIVMMGTPLDIVAESKEANVFEWNFGDSSKDTSNSGRMKHSYKKSGSYNLTLTVRGKGKDSNSITRKVFVSDGTSPFALIGLNRGTEELFLTPDTCDGKDAFIIDRSKAVNFSGKDSINVDGTTNGLSYSWKYMGKNSGQASFDYKFDELGCFPITLTVKSQKTGKINSQTEYVKIENLPPSIPGLTITASDLNTDPVIVKVSANNAKDPDGVIVSYLWYYYTDSDPEPQDFRITKGPSTTFVLPKVTGKYYFVLIAEDSNGAKVNTDELSDDKYYIQLSTDNLNTPIITLKSDKTSLLTGEEVNFNVTVKDILERDISNNVEYKWDFDGDGFYDQSTKTGKISHKFTTPGNINFKVKVTHKGISNTKFQILSVVNNLKPNFEYYSIGNKIVLFNTTEGTFTSSKWDLGNGVTSTNLDYFVYDFGTEKFPTSVNLEVSDSTSGGKNVDVGVRKNPLNAIKIEKSKDKLIAFTYPSIDDGKIHMRKAGDRMFVYLQESKGTPNKFCVDTDVKVDSDLNGTPDDDCDNRDSDSYFNGSPYVIKDFDKNIKERTMKFSIFNEDTEIESKNADVILDYVGNQSDLNKDVKTDTEIPESDRKSIEQLKDLISKSPDRDKIQLMKFFAQLQDSWFDDREKTKTIIDFESYVSANSSMDQKMKDQYYSLLESFLVSQSQAKDEVSLAAKVLKSLIPNSNPQYDKIIKNIDEILSHPTNTKLNKDLGTAILDAVKNDSNISNKDKLIIKTQLQVIIYGGQKNIPDSVTTSNQNEAGVSSTSTVVAFFVGFLKILGYFFILIIGLFAVLFAYFRATNKNDGLKFQDFIIDLFLQGKKEKSEEPKAKFEIKQESQVKKDDVLTSVLNQERPETALSIDTKEEIQNETKDISVNDATVSGESTPATGLPDWLRGASQTNEISSVPSEDIVDTVVTENSDGSDGEGLPLWLKGLDKGELESEINEELSGTKTEDNVSTLPQENELPDWLKGSSDSEEVQNIPEESTSPAEPELQAEPESEGGLPDWLKDVSVPQDIISEDIKSEEVIEQEATSETPQENELPDWLKGSSDSEEVQNIPEETNEEMIAENDKDTEKPKKPQPKKQGQKQVRKFDKKPQKKEDELLSQSSDDLPDWLK